MSARAIARMTIVLVLLAAFTGSTLLLLGCSDTTSGPAEETTGAAESSESTDEGPAGTYVGEFGATIDLEEYGTMDAMVPLTIEIAEDGTAEVTWEYSAESPMPEVDTVASSAELNGGLEGVRFGASGKATLEITGPDGTLNDSFGVVLQGEHSFDNIIGTVEFYGETEEFVVTKQ